MSPEAVLAALTLSDVVAPAALVVAVLAVLLAGPGRQTSRQRKQIDALRRSLKDTEARLAALAGVTGRGFASTLSALDFEAGLFERMTTSRLSEATTEELLEAHGNVRRGVERAWAEANLLSSDLSARVSAREQLNGRLADEHSAEVARLSPDTHAGD